MSKYAEFCGEFDGDDKISSKSFRIAVFEEILVEKKIENQEFRGISPSLLSPQGALWYPSSPLQFGNNANGSRVIASQTRCQCQQHCSPPPVPLWGRVNRLSSWCLSQSFFITAYCCHKAPLKGSESGGYTPEMPILRLFSNKYFFTNCYSKQF